jgi:hypothetical protein
MNETAVAFPMLIAVLVPLRLRMFPKYFTKEDLQLLDEIEKPKNL